MKSIDKTKDSQEFQTDKESNSKTTNKRGSKKSSKRGYSRGRRGNNSRNSNTSSSSRNARNAILESATRETPITTDHSMVFASDSAAMTSFGNLITTPGQENFIEDFNNVRYPSTYGWSIGVNAQTEAKRTANAMVIDVMPYFGCIGDAGGRWMAPIETAALNLKQYIDTSYGTHTNYDPQDLAIYLMAVASMFPLIAEIKRDLRLAYTFVENQYPQFVPQGLFAALMIADDQNQYSKGQGALYTAQHLRGFIDQLNQMIISFNRLPMPPEIIAFGYNDDLFDAIYTDSADIQTAQLYVFKNAGHWIYNEETGDDNVGSELIPILYGRNASSINAKLTVLAGCLERVTALRTSSSAMIQNLFNAFGSRDTITIPTMDINAIEPLPFIFDENICTMIENCVITDKVQFSFIQAVADGNVRAEVGVPFTTTSKPVDASTAITNLLPNIPLQFHKPANEVTHDDVGWALRLHPSYLESGLRTAKMDAAVAHPFMGLWGTSYCGFGFAIRATIIRINDNGYISFYELNNRAGANLTTLTPMLDFAYRPILVSTTTRDYEDGSVEVDILSYTAVRDVELTYRIEDLHMHWTYLTMNMWASNVNMNVVGSRTR